MVLNALAKPFFIALCGSILFFNSSEILAKIRTLASTAIPTVKTIPAIPGKVRVAPTIDITAVTKTKLVISAKFAESPKSLYRTSMKMKTRRNPIKTELTPFSIFSCPRVGPIVCSSTNFIGAANAPALNSSASSLAADEFPRPVILKLVPSTS